MFYLTSDCGDLCPACVQENLSECAGTADEWEDPQWFVVRHGVNWEDPHLHCDNCGDRIESAYAEWEAGVSR